MISVLESNQTQRRTCICNDGMTDTLPKLPQIFPCKGNSFNSREASESAIGDCFPQKTCKCSFRDLTHQNRTIAIASDVRIDGAKSPEIPQKEGVLGSEIAARYRKSLATFHRTLKSQCKVSEIASDFWGPRWASQSQIAKIAGISVR